MKKLLFALPVVLLLAAGCNSNQPIVEKNQQTTTPPPANTQTQQATTTQNDTTANWKVYNNSGVSFKYPSDWIVKNHSDAEGGFNLFIEDKKYENEPLNTFGLSISDTNNTDLSQAKNKHVFEEKDKHSTNFLENVISIYFKEGSKTYLFSCTASVDTCNKIIATFKASN